MRPLNIFIIFCVFGLVTTVFVRGSYKQGYIKACRDFHHDLFSQYVIDEKQLLKFCKEQYEKND